jgi:hypothetical protein
LEGQHSNVEIECARAEILDYAAENLRKRGLSHEERAGEGDDILVARTFVKLGGARFQKLRRELTGIVREYENAPGS